MIRRNLLRLAAIAMLAGPFPAMAQAQTKQPAAPPDPTERWTGDFDGMIERRLVRILVVFSKTEFFVDKGAPRGLMYELGKAFEDDLNRRFRPKAKNLRINVLFIPVARDQMIPALLEGRGDVAASVLTVTPERSKRVDFTAPFFRHVRELVVTGPESPPVARLDDLAGKNVFVRRSSSYWEHLERLNERFAAAGRAAMTLRAAPEALETEDILEMVNAGLVGVTVSDGYKARLWAKLLKSIRVHEDVAISTDNDAAWMVRKGSPKLLAVLDAFAKSHAEGTSFGNTVLRRYTTNTKFITDADAPAAIRRFEDTVALFRRYSTQYDMNYLLMMAQGYRESRLDQSARSPVGAIGIMQLMPATGRELGVGDIEQIGPNVHGGVEYVRNLIEKFYADQPMDPLNRTLFAFAAYNAGPGRIERMRREAASKGFDPNVWFGNVEVIVAAQLGAETVRYVSDIYKYYVAYQLIAEEEAARRKALDRARPGQGG